MACMEPNEWPSESDTPRKFLSCSQTLLAVSYDYPIWPPDDQNTTASLSKAPYGL